MFHPVVFQVCCFLSPWFWHSFRTLCFLAFLEMICFLFSYIFWPSVLFSQLIKQCSVLPAEKPTWNVRSEMVVKTVWRSRPLRNPAHLLLPGGCPELAALLQMLSLLQLLLPGLQPTIVWQCWCRGSWVSCHCFECSPLRLSSKKPAKRAGLNPIDVTNWMPASWTGRIIRRTLKFYFLGRIDNISR